MGSPTVLWVDDRPQALELRKAALESDGYCVKTASRGSSALKILLKILEETPVSAVLLEFTLGRHGREGSSPPYLALVPQSTDHPAFNILRDTRENFVASG